MRRRSPLFLALIFCGLFAVTAQATPVTYTFESPNFSLGQTTPLLNVAPNVGAGTFLTSFTDTIDATGYSITNIQENALMTGQSMFALTAISPLTLTFNTPVTSLSVLFAINVQSTGPAGSRSSVRGMRRKASSSRRAAPAGCSINARRRS